MFPLQAGHCTCPKARCSTIGRTRLYAKPLEKTLQDVPGNAAPGVQNTHSTHNSVDGASNIPHHSKVLTTVPPLLDVSCAKKSPNLVQPINCLASHGRHPERSISQFYREKRSRRIPVFVLARAADANAAPPASHPVAAKPARTAPQTPYCASPAR